MTSGFDQAMSDVLGRLDKRRDDVVRVHQTLDEVTSTVRSRRRQVSATVDARGELDDLKFHGQTYKSMEPADLAKVIIETIKQARDEARAQMWSSLADADPESALFAQTASEVDWSQQFAHSLELPEQLMNLLRTPPENLLDSEDLNELLAILSGKSNRTDETRVEGDGGASPDSGAADGRARPPSGRHSRTERDE